MWKTYQWAPEWYTDAKAETGKSGLQARRREIIFAVALAESFLFEFVLVEVLAETNDRFQTINDYFPAGSKRTIQDRWKKVPKELVKRGLGLRVPDLGGEEWQDFTRLLDFRNGLLHGRSSRPDTLELPEGHRPFPSPEDLQAMKPGDALETVLTQIRSLCVAAGHAPPDWIPSGGPVAAL